MNEIIQFNIHLPSVALGIIATTTATIIVLLFEQTRALKNRNK